MTQPDQNIPELDGVLADAIEGLKQAPVSETLIERCRDNALAIAATNPGKRNQRPTQSPNWVMALAIAASVLVAVNIAKAIFHQPPADRQVTAVLQLPDGQNQLVYSDQTIEMALESNLLPRSN